ncbi:Rpn family recombination-promoting nuclease/putative transposase [Palleniella muris]|uniref:Rpn family recombination-promoting nuclease/putative transposase n=1 Tax=Palleniella muris TaxID=3038145 RepID=A0AC61QNV0_9BACT|nr:Rpn family recombination-promoting nuclease/putative transposase [Palleniella muris]TGX81389.1 Rpn family recombination-promoting nuclease/putative transposase [Palleniella muris]
MAPFVEEAKYINPYTDFGFKFLFGTECNKEFLIEFLNALLPMDQKIQDITYLNPEQLGDTAAERKSVFDVYCHCDDGSYVIVEMQRAPQVFFKDRCVYYSSFPIRHQGKKSQWDYKLSAVYTVGVLDFKFDDDEEYYHHEVQLVDKATGEVFYDKLTYVFLEMPKFKKEINECETIMDKWLFVLKNMARLLDRPIELQERVFERLFRTAEIAKMSHEELFSYEESLKNYRDWRSTLDKAADEGHSIGLAIGLEKGFEKGRAEGLEKGREEGRAEGIAEGMRATAIRMLSLGLDHETISKVSRLTIEEIKTLDKQTTIIQVCNKG